MLTDSNTFMFEPSLKGYHWNQDKLEEFDVESIRVVHILRGDEYLFNARGKIGDKSVAFIDNWSLDRQQALGSRYQLQEMTVQAIEDEIKKLCNKLRHESKVLSQLEAEFY